MFWKSNALHCDYSAQYFIICFKVSKRLDLKYSQHKEEMIWDLIEVDVS